MRARVATGVEGLDDILHGGLPPGHLYLVTGPPGSGKTTLGLQFLLEGARADAAQSCAYVALSESARDLREIAESHGWDLGRIEIADLTGRNAASRSSDYTFFHPAEIELGETMEALMEAVDRISPTRLVVDSLSELRMLARDPLRYRRHLLELKHEIGSRDITTLLLDVSEGGAETYPVESIVHGVVRLEQRAPLYGEARRRVEVQKLRGSAFAGGHHDMAIERGGVRVFSRLSGEQVEAESTREPLESGVEELDALVGGGLSAGTSTMILGPSGVGKSSLAAQYVHAATSLDKRVLLYSFDEPPRSWLDRAEGMSIPVRSAVEAGNLRCERIEPTVVTPGELAQGIRRAVESDGVEMVVLDSLNGYLAAMPDERFLQLHLHELLGYLSERRVWSLLVMAQHGMIGPVHAPIELSYVADTLIIARYFEAFGRVRQALSVAKRRSGPHERAIRELSLTPQGIRVGEELREFSGVLEGRLVYAGGRGPLLNVDEER